MFHLRLSASCRQAHFVFYATFFKEIFISVRRLKKSSVLSREKGRYYPPFDRKEVRTWNLIAENFKSNVPFRVSVKGCCTTKRVTPTTKSGDAGNGKYLFATLPCMRNDSFTPLTSIFKMKKLNRVIKWQEKR